ncbi:ImmA/IrrE family metallo-endopeptidase [Streptomyces sp. NPDC013740]|uniref:ImmA/IrrE family metallo-endopeptidase n=1 Tax=Streptomyces sp. NPDC013740 TaxID=3364867 RepID=UPI0036FC173B
MAPENWPSLKAARTRAKTLVEKFDLTPPIDIKSLLLERAQVEYVSWSHECDAVTVLGDDPPRVFVRDDLPPLRERFTLAHELAHIQLAWHVGTVNCQIDAGVDAEYSLAAVSGAQEREANEFASRLLAPDRWLSPLVQELSSFERTAMQKVLDSLAEAQMSAHAGLIALSRYLLPGHAFFVDQSFAISRSTSWPGQAPLNVAEVEQYLERCVSVEEFSHQGRTIFWAITSESVEPSFQIQVNSVDVRTPHQILTACCGRVFGEEFAKSKAMSINGVVGGLTNDIELHWHEAAIVSVVRQRIEERDDLRDVLVDEEFSMYLEKKAQSIVQKRSDAAK